MAALSGAFGLDPSVRDVGRAVPTPQRTPDPGAVCGVRAVMGFALGTGVRFGCVCACVCVGRCAGRERWRWREQWWQRDGREADHEGRLGATLPPWLRYPGGGEKEIPNGG